MSHTLTESPTTSRDLATATVTSLRSSSTAIRPQQSLQMGNAGQLPRRGRWWRWDRQGFATKVHPHHPMSPSGPGWGGNGVNPDPHGHHIGQQPLDVNSRFVGFSQTHWETQLKFICATYLSQRLGRRDLAVPRWVRLWGLLTVLPGVMGEELSLVRIAITLNEGEDLCLLCLRVSHQLTSFGVPNNVDYIYMTLCHRKGSLVSLQIPVPPLGIHD